MRRRRFSHLLLIALTLCLHARTAGAQDSIPITGDRLSGFVLPIEPIAGDIRLASLKAVHWTVDDTKRLVMRGDVVINIGSYELLSDEAVVWINRLPSADGVINQIAVYFERVIDPTKRAGTGVQGGQLLVTGSTRGEVKLNVALLNESGPDQSILTRTAETRLAEYLKKLLVQPPALRQLPKLEQPNPRDEFIPVPGGRVAEKDLKLPEQVTLPAANESVPWLAAPRASVRFSADHVEIASSEVENVITIMGNIVVEYFNRDESLDISQLLLTAERAVIFTDPGPLDQVAGQLDATIVRGVYLEGNVQATGQNGQYIVRSPHVYYDFRTRQAIMLDSLLRVQDRLGSRPVYARATEMRQLSETQWQTNKVQASTSEFFTPHLAIGAKQMTITERPRTDGGTDTYINSKGNTMRVAGVPLVPWPNFNGRVQDVALRNVEIGTRKNDGFRMLTTWDLFTLAGMEHPEGVEADLKLDGYTDRGAGGGIELRYDVGKSEGNVDLYGMFDEGTDRTSSGRDVEPDSSWRGLALFEHQTELSRHWSLQAQLALISDETFITGMRDGDFIERREYETAVYLKHQRDNAAFTALAKYDFNGFLSNDYLLASQGYSVDKVPELTYRRYGDSLFGDKFTYSTENRASRMRLVIQSSTPREIGVRPGAFPFDYDTEIDDAFRAAGYRTNYVSRFDSRHELAMPMKAGIFNVTPYVVGRFTGYSDDFEDFSSDSDDMRFYGAGGVRVSTQFQHVDNSIESSLFDLNRVRHLVEPYLTVWSSATNVDQEDLPVYDTEVESLADGTALQIGLRNVWQTQRGGPGRWRSVDWVTLDTSLVFDSEGEPDESPTPQFFDYRPEYSQFGDHFRVVGAWLLSDTVSVVGESVYAFENNDFARGALGFELRHSPDFVTFIEYRHIEASDNDLLSVGWDYQMTRKYRLYLSPNYDLRDDEFRSLTARLTRQFPDFEFTLQIKYDQIRDDTTLGASIGLVEF